MGLSGPRKRQKISHDPNNTHWTSNTTTFGRRMLASQGWSPGQTLGRRDASHATHFTTASASHVRIALREDNLGLGAKPGSGQGPGECTGLDSFQDLLGRLNGKSEAIIQKERQGRANVNRILYAERKYGGWSRFVSAGLLVGGDITLNQLDTTGNVITQKSSKVFKEVAGSVDASVQQDRAVSEKKAKKGKIKIQQDVEVGSIKVAKADEVDPDEKARRKAEKIQRRAEKAQRKEDRLRRKQEKAVSKSMDDSTSTPVSRDLASQTTSTAPSRSSASVSAIPIFAGGRHAVRQRYIMQKKAAMLDAKALNEILMVKT